MQNRGDIKNLEITAKTREFQKNSTGDEVKKLIKYYVKAYYIHKGENGNLISNSITIILSNYVNFLMIDKKFFKKWINNILLKLVLLIQILIVVLKRMEKIKSIKVHLIILQLLMEKKNN